VYLGKKLQVMLDTQVRIETERLRDVAQALFDRPGLGCNIVPQHRGRRRVKIQQPNQNSQQGGFARAIRSDDAKNARLVNGQVDAVERHHLPEALTELDEGNDRCCHRRLYS
jgi:hypothetical protein